MFGSLFGRLEARFSDRRQVMQRREMLKASLAGAAGLLLSESLAGAASRRQPGKHVLVVGAGLGGLSCAYELKSAGYEVTVVEPRYRLGGRVHTLENFLKDRTVEAGGELIGMNHPTWHAYARQFGLNLVELPAEGDAHIPVVLGGEQLEEAEARALWQEIRSALTRINGDAAKVNADEPWKSENAQALDLRTTAEWIDQLDASERCKLGMSVQLTAINGMLPAWQSYLANLAMVKGGGLDDYWTQTDALRCEGGNQQLPEEIADEIGPGNFVLGQRAVRIERPMNEDPLRVTLTSGRVIEADDVVLAAPVSTWGRIRFDPPLPAALTPQMGTNTKFLVAVKQRFWQDVKRSARSLSDGPVTLTWEATAGQPGEEGFCLLAYAGGPASDEAIGWSDKERAEKYLAQLDLAYPGIADHFMHARFVNWHNDSLARGSYSFPAPGQVLAHGPTLTQGLGRLHFAGEHCCYAFIGYMEGALQSGVRLARRLARRDGVAG
jgi:monoamine oxidase